MKGKISKEGAFWALVFFLMAFIPGPVFSENRPDSGPPTGTFDFQLSLDHQTVTLRSDGAPLSVLLGEIAGRTGIVIVFDPEVDTPVTASMEEVSVRSALHHLLRGVGVAEIWPVAGDSGGSPGYAPSRIYVFPQSKSSPGRNAVILGRAPGSPGFPPTDETPVAETAAAKTARFEDFLPFRPRGEYGYQDKMKSGAYLNKKKQVREELRVKESGGDAKADKARALAAYLGKFEERDSKFDGQKPGGAK